MKLKLIAIAVLAFGSMAHAQGILSRLSIGGGVEGIFPASTFTKSLVRVSQPPNTQATTYSSGYVGDLRYEFGRHSALGVAVTYNRDSEIFYDGNFGSITRYQSNNGEIIGSYIARLPSREHMKPYVLVGGGIVRFSPNSSFSGATPSTDSKFAFAYGFGSDFPVSDHWGLRLQYRGLLRSEPDFKLIDNTGNPFGTGLKTHIPEPSIQIVYHF